jgi:magnesium chelatase family protein
MLVKTYGSALLGIDPIVIDVEVNVDSRGQKFFMVGLPDNAVKESQQRITAALKNCGYRMPYTRIIVNLSPADIRKEGSGYDLAIALGILGASGQTDTSRFADYLVMGEMSLDGNLRPVKGALSVAAGARTAGFKGLVLPYQNAPEAAVVEGIDIIPARNLTDVTRFMATGEYDPVSSVSLATQGDDEVVDFSEVKGQESVKRALEVAAAGGHNIILIGPPGVGKTMLARRIPTILPPLTPQESLETTKIHSVAGCLPGNTSLIRTRPFRSPHHTVSDVALVGGGSIPRPGEISLAHNGILFLDELPEFKRNVLEVLRQPLEDRHVTIARTRVTIQYPASFMLVASMNPSPSGNFYDASTSPDSEQSVRRYLSRISGPLMDRIDLHIEVNPIPYHKLSSNGPAESSEEIRTRVLRARNRQLERFRGAKGVYCNAQMQPRQLKDFARVDKAADGLLKTAVEKLGFSARSYARILKVARTIADLSDSDQVMAEHLAEAIQYRSLDRNGWLG